MDIFVAVYFMMLACITEGQKTYQRACDCEYKINGKCAYTLLLPVGQGSSGGGTCPTSVPNEDQISAIQTDISKVKTELSDQSRMLNQLQSSMLELSGRNTTNKMAGGDCDGCDAVKTKTDQLAMQIDALNTTLMSQKDMMNSLQSKVLKYVDDIDALMKVSSTEKLLNESKSLQTYVKQLQETVDNLTITNKLCQKKGLLVTGTEHRIPDLSITVSSQYDETHAPNASRIWHIPEEGSKLSGAWCPDDSNNEPNEREEWLQYDLGKEMTIYGAVTQGRHDYPQWVTWYMVRYTNETPTNATKWQTFSDVTGAWQYQSGNSDQKSTKVNWFWEPFRARYVRIIPTWGGWHEGKSTNMCMRADVIGCLD